MRRLLLLAFALLISGCLSSYGGASGGGGGGGGTGTGGGSSSGGGGGSDPGPVPSGAPTYYADVLPVFQKSCFSCHDSTAPNATQPYLDQIDQVKANANVIVADVTSRRMPPFPPEAGCNSYVDERRISAGDEQMIEQWAMMGAYAGDPQSAPPYTPPATNSLGTPDQHVVAGPFTPHYPGSAGADDLYWCFPLAPGITNASDLTAMNIVPGSKGQVHHVIVFRDPGGQGSSGQPASGFECNGAPGEMIDGWVPGARPLELPSGVGMTIDPSDRLLMQVHYHRDPNVTIAPDSTAVDLYFAKSTMPEHAFVVWSGTPLFTIPANTTGYNVNSTCTANGSWKLLGIAPHMHQHAKKFRSDLTVGGAGQCLMNIANWDFGWQGGYFLSQPIQLSSGDTVKTTCTYDNPSASQIKFGEATTDEMCFGFLYVVAAQKPTFNGVVNLFGGQNAASICAN